MRFSRRSSVHATDVRSLRASHVTSTNSGPSDIFCPKPPPTSGATTRRSDSGMPSTSAMAVRSMCGARLHRRGVLARRPDRYLDALRGARSRVGELLGFDAPFDDDVRWRFG